MSGGRYDYIQFNMQQAIEELAEDIALSNHAVTWRERMRPETIEELKKGLALLRKATVYINRIDWLLSGDDGETRFRERLAEDLEKGGFNEQA